MKRPSRQSERGAAIVEAALVTPVVFLLIFGVFQCALMSRSYLAVRSAATDGARSGAVAATSDFADSDVLMAVARAAVSLGDGDISRVVVFKADGPDTSVPPACLTGPVSGKCNVYSDADLDRPSTDFGEGGWFGDDAWAAPDRSASLLGDIDYLGVFVEARTRNDVGGPFPSTLSYTAVVRLQPVTT